MTKKDKHVKDVAPVTTDVTSTDAPVTDAPAVAPEAPTVPAQVTLEDLIKIVSFLENLAQMNRLSQIEIAGIKEPFERIVAFLQAANAANAQQSTSEVSTDEIVLPEVSTKKKGKK